MEDKTLKYSLINPGNLMELCWEVIERHGLKKALSGRTISDMIDDMDIKMNDPLGIAGYFEKGTRITLSTIEALSMVYLTFYYQHKANPNSKYVIGIDIEDDMKKLYKEEYLSDGLLAEHYKKEEPRISPFQQVMAQNLLGENKGKNIEDEVIKQCKRKTDRRDSYNKICGLLITVITDGGSIDLKRICDECDIRSFEPTFLLLYQDNLKECMVVELGKNLTLEDMKERALTITPSLKPQ